jgi:ferredoxin
VSHVEERLVHGLRVAIDRDLCVGFGDCVKEAPAGFALDAETIATFLAPDTVEPAQLLRACDACPVDAITVWDAAGRQLVPAPAASTTDT